MIKVVKIIRVTKPCVKLVWECWEFPLNQVGFHTSIYRTIFGLRIKLIHNYCMLGYTYSDKKIFFNIFEDIFHRC